MMTVRSLGLNSLLPCMSGDWIVTAVFQASIPSNLKRLSSVSQLEPTPFVPTQPEATIGINLIFSGTGMRPLEAEVYVPAVRLPVWLMLASVFIQTHFPGLLPFTVCRLGQTPTRAWEYTRLPASLV
ncbi:hypothetical protein EDB85DRAFT_1988593 [Lactarius pseudohatsudake]|nr:hypothetical protein EDB85DRAFT_1988593 [Lactarius pseudohatsudake]